MFEIWKDNNTLFFVVYVFHYGTHTHANKSQFIFPITHTHTHTCSTDPVSIRRNKDIQHHHRNGNSATLPHNAKWKMSGRLQGTT